MDFNEVLAAISSVGFPIIACCFMAWLYVKLVDTLSQLTNAITEMSTKITLLFDGNDEKDA